MKQYIQIGYNSSQDLQNPVLLGPINYRGLFRALNFCTIRYVIFWMKTKTFSNTGIRTQVGSNVNCLRSGVLDQSAIQPPPHVCHSLLLQSWSSLVEGDEGLYLPNWWAVVLMKCQNKTLATYSTRRTITKFCLTMGQIRAFIFPVLVYVCLGVCWQWLATFPSLIPPPFDRYFWESVSSSATGNKLHRKVKHFRWEYFKRRCCCC